MEAYLEAWTSSLASLLSQLSSTSWKALPAKVAEGYCPVFRLSVSSRGGLSGKQWVGLAAADAAQLLGLFLPEASELSGELHEEQREALEELFRQWSGLVATTLSSAFGEVSLEVSRAEPSAISATFLLQASDGLHSLSALAEIDETIIASLRPPESLPVPAGSVASTLAVEDCLHDGNLQLLMGVKLDVMLRFGRKSSPLRDVLELSPGTIVELEQKVTEPVELLLNDRVIAWGEVVVMDGNYGLQVTKVAPSRRRLNTM